MGFGIPNSFSHPFSLCFSQLVSLSLVASLCPLTCPQSCSPAPSFVEGVRTHRCRPCCQPWWCCCGRHRCCRHCRVRNVTSGTDAPLPPPLLPPLPRTKCNIWFGGTRIDGHYPAAVDGTRSVGTMNLRKPHNRCRHPHMQDGYS